MCLKKRLQKIETSLTPKQAVLFWLQGMLELDHDNYMEKLFADRRNPRVLVLTAVGEAVRENVGDPLLKPELMEQAVREAQKQADMLFVLILNLHEHVRSGCENTDTFELISERWQRMLLEAAYQERSEPKEWESWRDKLTATLTSLLALRETVTSISSKYYDGHPLLFAADQDRLNEQIAYLEDKSKMYNDAQHTLRDWKPITIPSRVEHVEAMVASLVDRAKVKTLATFGESQAAGELLGSCRLRTLREIKQLLSSSSRRDSTS